jgi:hypothetical protein
MCPVDDKHDFNAFQTSADLLNAVFNAFLLSQFIHSLTVHFSPEDGGRSSARIGSQNYYSVCS